MGRKRVEWRRGCSTTTTLVVVVGGLEGYFKRGARPLMERFLGLERERNGQTVDREAGLKIERTRCEMTATADRDLPCS